MAAMAAAGPGNASFAAPAPAALPLADSATLELFPSLNDSALAHEIATSLGNMTAVVQTPSRSGTPGWTTALLAALISVAVLVSLGTVFVLLHRNLRRQRREVLESFLSFQEAEAAAIEVADSARQRFLARASRAAAQSPRQPREPPVVVVQPDLSASLCIKEVLSRPLSGSGREGGEATTSTPAALAGSSFSGHDATSSGSGSSGAGSSGGQRQADDGSAAAEAAAAAARPEVADVEAGPAAGSGSANAARAARAASVRRLALDFPGLGATVLLLLPSGSQSAGVLLWNDGSGATVLPGASWRGWGAQPPHEPPPVFHSTIELVAQEQEEQEEQQEEQQPEQQQQQQQQGEGAEGAVQRPPPEQEQQQ